MGARDPHQVSSSITFHIVVVVGIIIIMRQTLSLNLGLVVWARETSQL